MANTLYLPYRNRLIGSGSLSLPDWDADTIKAVLCTATYTANTTTDSTLDDVPSGTRVATQTVTGITIASGIALSTVMVVFSSVPAGSPATQMVLYKDTGVSSTSPLLIYYDTFSAGMPVTPNGRDIQLGFDVQGIFGF